MNSQTQHPALSSIYFFIRPTLIMLGPGNLEAVKIGPWPWEANYLGREAGTQIPIIKVFVSTVVEWPTKCCRKLSAEEINDTFMEGPKIHLTDTYWVSTLAQTLCQVLRISSEQHRHEQSLWGHSTNCSRGDGESVGGVQGAPEGRAHEGGTGIPGMRNGVSRLIEMWRLCVH